MKNKMNIEITSAFLHIFAMICMFCDHLSKIILHSNEWLIYIGRIAFPIFAFLIVEGYFYTKNLRRYVFRLLFFAVISEIPFNIAVSGCVFYPLHQNVIWTFLIAIFFIYINEKAKNTNKFSIQLFIICCSIILGSIISFVTMTDYRHIGFLTIFVFYCFRERKLFNYFCQFICLFFIYTQLANGFMCQLYFLGKEISFPRQIFALLALIPIWLYHGKQGFHNKKFQYFCYLFYPFHLFIFNLFNLIRIGGIF